MKATLTLNKTDLLDRLTARRNEVADKFVAELKKWNDELDSRADAETQIRNLAAWHQEIALGLSDGSITLTPSGSLKGAPAKPSAKSGLTTHRSTHYDRDDPRYYPVEVLNTRILHIEKQRDASLKPLDTAIDLIGLSVGETVEVNSADYQALLNGSTDRYGYGF